MNKLKELWAEWKVGISFVGGALVVATTYGTCTVTPAQAPTIDTETAPAVQVEEAVPLEEEPKPSEGQQ